MPHLSSRWKPQPVFCAAPPDLRPWLTAPDSLTARIVARCRRFSVRIVGESYRAPNRDETYWLDLAPAQRAWVRDVLLVADDRPVVFAHSVVARRSLRGPWNIARAIGNRPLGAALFADPKIVRGEIEFARIDQRHALFDHARCASGICTPLLWGRRSYFFRLGHALGVTEIFLPDITRL